MSDADLRETLKTADQESRETILRDFIRTQVAALLSLGSIDDDANFLENGLNSMSALELTKNLMELTGMEIPLIAIVDHPTPAELAAHVAGEYAGAKNSAPNPTAG